MLHLAPAAAGPRRSRVLNRGNPTSHFPKRLISPNSQRCQWFPRLSCQAVALVDTPHPAPRPRAARFLLVPATRVLVLTEGPPVAQAAFAPSNIKFPASRTKFSLLKSFSTHSKKVARVGLTWTLLGLVPADVKSTFTCIHVQGRPRAAGCGRESSGFGEGGG